MELLTCNIAGKPRRAQLYGRDYLVAPLTLVVPGVLNGSDGPLLYPEDELRRDPSVWNHMPLVLQHPAVEGKYISARKAEVLNKSAVGLVLHAKANGKLTAEGWFSVDDSRRVSPQLLGMLEQGQQVELSTGLRTTNEPTKGVHNGREYTAVARDYRPDHVAVLLGQTGACSIEDGCGVNVNVKANEEIVDSVDVATLNVGDRWERIFVGNGTDPKYRITRVRNVTKKEGDENLPASAYAYTPDPAKPSTWKLRIDDATHVSAAVAAIGKGFRGQKVAIPAADLPAVKKAIRAAWLKHYPKKTQKDLPPILRNEGKAMNDEERKAAIDSVMECCPDVWDQETLNELKDDQLERVQKRSEHMSQQEAVLNAATKDYTDSSGAVHKWDAEAKQWKTEVKEIVANQKKEDDAPPTADEWLDTAPAEIQSAVRNAMDIEAREKRTIVERLTANIKDEQEQAKQADRLMARSLQDLRADVELLPPTPTQTTANYAGAVGTAPVRGLDESRFASFGLPSEYLNLEEK